MTFHECSLVAGLALGTVGFGVRAVAQELPTGTAGWEVHVSNAVTPSNPSTTVEVWARHVPEGPSPITTLGQGDFDLVASDGWFSNARWIWWGGPRLGTPSGSAIRGVFWLQPGFPEPPWVANPYPLWAVTWTTSDFTPRRVPLETASTTTFTLLYEPYWFHFSMYPHAFFRGRAEIRVGAECYPDCDTSTGLNVLDIFDFLCFQNLYAAADPIACDCDTTTGGGVCDIFDFLCFRSRFVAGCP